MLRCGSLPVDVGMLAVSLPLHMSSMLAGGRGPHIIRPASSLLGRGPGLAERGMSARPESGRLGAFAMPRFTHRKVISIGATARVVAQRAPETLTLVRHRRPPTAETIARLSVTAVFAYLVALPLPLPGAAQPILAPLTALLVVQVSLYQTLRSAVHRVAAVVTGVLLAIALADLAGFTWWSLGLTIAAGLAVGSALHLGDAILEVPISAMLILSDATRAAAVGRIAETAIGTAAGLIAGFVFTTPRLQPAEEAIEDLCRKLSGLLTAMADGLAAGSALDAAGGWLARARSLSGEIRRVDDALREAEESL